MNSIDIVELPSDKPVWLEHWSKNNLPESAFAPGVKFKAAKLAPTMNFTHGDFMPTGLAVTVDGKYRPQWFFRGGQWTCQCTCGYPKATCLHTFLLARIMDRTITQRNWPGQRQGAPASPIGRKVSPRVSAREMIEAAAKSGKAAIVIEADFKLNPGEVTLRFYLDTAHNREILRMQRLHNIAAKLRRDGVSTFDFSPEDQDFLKWFHGLRHPKQWLSKNLQVYKVSESQFSDWEKEWLSQPRRFIERDSQKPLNRQVRAGIVFQLQDEGEKTKIHCLLSVGDKRYPFHEVLSSMRERKYVILEGALIPMTLPLKWETLVECFGKKAPSMPKAAVCDHFPLLIENKFRLIEGKNIRQQKRKSKLELAVMKKHGQIVLQVTADQKPFILNAGASQPQKLSRDKNGYVITAATGDNHQETAAFLLSLPLEEMGPGQWVIGSAFGLKQLLSAWPTLTEKLETKVDPLLEGLFKAQKAEVSLNLRPNNNWLECQTMWRAGHVHLEPGEIHQALRRGESLIRSKSGDWLQMDLEAMRQSVDHLDSLGLKTDGGRTMNFAGAQIVDSLDDDGPVRLHRNSKRIAAELRQQSNDIKPTISADFGAELRNYQKEGWDFLCSRLLHNVGAILADDMGLGKTVQTLAFIDTLRQHQQAPVLVIAPASVMYVWQKEAERFCPNLRVQMLTGTPKQRQAILDDKGAYDLLISSYNLVRMDINELRQKELSLVVLDEAQHIKNPKAQVTKAVNKLSSDRRLALSGTPVENSLNDMWSIMNFLNPGYLGTFDDFQLRFSSGGKELGQRISPLILRRTKEKVTPELPARTEEVIYCDMPPAQYEVYQNLLSEARAKSDAGHIQILASLTKLRQACCDPRLIEKDAASAKIDALKEMLQPIVAEGHSVLIFSQFTSMLSIIEDEIKDMAPQFKITGETPVAKRPQIVDDFNDEEDASVFLLSLKAAGTGLTLTKADYVFIFDPWWNPAAERQAVDRTHRIGQEKPVFVYRLVTRHTVEEKILDLQDEKRKLAGDVLQEDLEFVKGLKPTDLASLLD